MSAGAVSGVRFPQLRSSPIAARSPRAITASANGANGANGGSAAGAGASGWWGAVVRTATEAGSDGDAVEVLEIRLRREHPEACRARAVQARCCLSACMPARLCKSLSRMMRHGHE